MDSQEPQARGPAEHPDPERYNRRVRARIRERQCWELAAQGWSQPAIARKLGIKQPSVWKALRRAEKRAIEAADAYVQGLKVRQTAVLENLAHEALQAWQRSKQPGRKKKVEASVAPAAGGKGKGEATPEKVTSEALDRDGNPAFLAEARAALADVRKLWGLDRDERGDEGSGATPLDRVSAVVIQAVGSIPLPEEARQVALEHLSRSLLEGADRGRDASDP